MLGKTVVDKITGFKGVVTGRVEYLTGRNQLLIAPKAGDDGKMTGSEWLDEQRCVVDESVAAVTLDNGKTPGGDRPAPKR